MNFNVAHQRTLQYLLAKGYGTEKDISAFAEEQRRALGEDDEKLVWKEFQQQLIDAVKPLGLTIRGVRSEVDGTLYYGIANVHADENAKLGSVFAQNEIQYFKAVLDSIIENGGVISRGQAIDLREGKTYKVKIAEAEQLLTQFVKQGWLHKNEDKQTFTAGIRTFIDLQEYLESRELTKCVICSEPVLMSTRCGNAQCPAKFHLHCAAEWISRRAEKDCPACRVPWKN